jgi:hypothetical protein
MRRLFRGSGAGGVSRFAAQMCRYLSLVFEQTGNPFSFEPFARPMCFSESSGIYSRDRKPPRRTEK